MASKSKHKRDHAGRSRWRMWKVRETGGRSSPQNRPGGLTKEEKGERLLLGRTGGLLSVEGEVVGGEQKKTDLSLRT